MSARKQQWPILNIREFERSCDEIHEILRSGASRLSESESGSNVEEGESDTNSAKRLIQGNWTIFSMIVRCRKPCDFQALEGEYDSHSHSLYLAWSLSKPICENAHVWQYIVWRLFTIPYIVVRIYPKRIIVEIKIVSSWYQTYVLFHPCLDMILAVIWVKVFIC